MKFSSSVRRNVAALLAAALAAEPAALAALARAEEPAEPCLVLKFAGPGVPDNAAKAWLDDLPSGIAGSVRVRWVADPELLRRPAAESPEPATASSADLERIAGIHDEAKARLEKLETADAARLLAEAEREGSKLPATEPAAGLLARIHLTRAGMLLWEGDEKGAAEALGTARALSPDLAPDPAAHPPRLIAAWSEASRGGTAAARLTVRSVPDGARVLVDGAERGTTPATIDVRPRGTVEVRIERKGYFAAGRTVRCLPGEAVAVSATLAPDRRAALEDALASRPAGPEARRLVAEAIERAGAERAAVFLVRREGDSVSMDVFSFGRGAGEPRAAGRLEGDAGGGAPGDAAARAAGMLVAAGWPPTAEFAREKKTAWYHKWWFWGAVGVAAAGIAMALSGSSGGGGGSGGSGSAGSISVNF